jgi:hypothetical protein
VALAIVDHGILAWIESAAAADARSGVRLATRSWQQENERINENNFTKVRLAPDEWIWRSQGFPATEERRKAHRILVVGDSFVWGDGYVNANDIWWRQSNELRRRGMPTSSDGARRRGASTRNELERLRKVLPRYRPDLVIWSYVTNDADEGLVKQFDYEAQRDASSGSPRHADGARRDSSWSSAAARSCQTCPAKTRLRIQRMGAAVVDGESRRLQKTLRRRRADARSRTPYFFITPPTIWRSVVTARYAPSSALFARHRLRTPDFVVAYPPAAARTTRLGHQSCHGTRRGVDVLLRRRRRPVERSAAALDGAASLKESPPDQRLMPAKPRPENRGRSASCTPLKPRCRDAARAGPRQPPSV